MESGQRRAVVTGGVALSVILVVAVVAAAVGTWGTDNSGPGGLRGNSGELAALRSFDDCDALLGELQDSAISEYEAYSEYEDQMVFEDVGRAVDGGAVDESSGGAESAPTQAGAPSTTAPLPRTGPAADASQEGEAATGSPEWGGTNIQESGVDEPDVWKTDGDRLLVIDSGTLRAIDLSGDQPAIVGELSLPNGGGQLLVDGDVALVVGDGAYLPMDGPQFSSSSNGSAGLVAIDISDPAAMSVIGQSTLEGSLVSARLVDGMARVVTTTYGPSVYAEPTADFEQSVRDTTIEAWLPRFEVSDENGDVIDDGSLVDCDSVYVAAAAAPTDPGSTDPESTDPAPPDPGGADSTMINVVSLDLRADELRPVDGTSVIGAGSTVYASPTSVYVAGYGYDPETGASTTDVHKFETPGREPASYRSSARVEGSLLNQFSMSEHNGDLRIAVTTDGFASVGGVSSMPAVGVAEDAPVPDSAPSTTIVDDAIDPSEPIAPPAGSSESRVIVLRDQGGALEEIGRVDGLGATEQIYSVRFMGDVAYVVTFRRTDPLYTIDLSDPANPTMVGELKIPGYSSYLHPVGDGLLLGIGQDATETGQTTGFQIALFDVADLANPQQIQKLVLPNGSSIAENDHHAFTWWAEDNLAMVPLTDYTTGSDSSLSVFAVDPSAITERAQITHPSTGGPDGGGVSAPCPPNADCIEPPIYYGSPGIQRSMVVDGNVITLSSAGVKLSALDSFADVAWLPFS